VESSERGEARKDKMSNWVYPECIICGKPYPWLKGKPLPENRTCGRSECLQKALNLRVDIQRRKGRFALFVRGKLRLHSHDHY